MPALVQLYWCVVMEQPARSGEWCAAAAARAGPHRVERGGGAVVQAGLQPRHGLHGQAVLAHGVLAHALPQRPAGAVAQHCSAAELCTCPEPAPRGARGAASKRNAQWEIGATENTGPGISDPQNSDPGTMAV